MCIDIVDICSGIANGQISSILDRAVCQQYSHILFQDNNLSKSQWIFTKIDTCMCIDIVEISFGIAHCQISSIFDKVICPGNLIMAGNYPWFHICLLLLLCFIEFFVFNANIVDPDQMPHSAASD